MSCYACGAQLNADGVCLCGGAGPDCPECKGKGSMADPSGWGELFCPLCKGSGKRPQGGTFKNDPRGALSLQPFHGKGDTVSQGDTIQAVKLPSGWYALSECALHVREAIWSCPNDAGAQEIAREANRRATAGME